MKDKNKTLLNEGTVRRFMALAGVESLVNPFLKKVNEEAKLQTEIEANLGAASDAKMGGGLPPPTAPEEEALDEYGTGPGGAPDIGGKAPGEGPVGEVPEEGQPTMEEELLHEEIPEVDISDTSEWDPADVPESEYLPATGKGASGYVSPSKPGFGTFERGSQTLTPPSKPTMQEALTSRTLAESILRHIPNLEIINDEPSLKTRRQSDILSEVTKRVKQLLSK